MVFEILKPHEIRTVLLIVSGILQEIQHSIRGECDENKFLSEMGELVSKLKKQDQENKLGLLKDSMYQYEKEDFLDPIDKVV